MANGIQAPKSGGDSLEPAITKLRGLSRESQAAVASVIDRLALAEGVLENDGHRPPIESIDLWLTKLRSERKSERTIGLYEYCARRILRQIPTPTRADVSEYLARRIGETSPSSAETERKALASLFSFLRSEGMWPENPLDGVRHIGPRWGEQERKCPSVEDVGKVLEVGCARANDSLKIRTVIALLATTGLRLTDYIGERRSDSPFIFPGNTRTGYAEIYNVEKTLKRACLRAGVEPFTPHQLRHLYATEMLRNGAYGVIILNDSTTTATAQTRVCLISYIFEWISSTTKVPV